MRRVRTAILWTTLVVLIVLTAAVTLLVWRLDRGPIPLPWLDPRIEQALGNLGPDLHATVERTELAWVGWVLDVRVIELRLRRTSGSLVASLPLVSVRPSIRALLHGRFAVSQIGLAGVKIDVVRTASGDLTLPGIGGESPPEGSGVLGLLVPDASRSGDVTYLRRIYFRDATLSLDDERSGARWDLSGFHIDIRRGREGITSVAEGRLRLRSGTVADLRALSLHFATNTTTEISEGAVSRASGTLVVDDGEIALRGDAAPPLPIRKLGLSAVYSPADHTIDVDDAHAEVGGGSVSARADVVLADGERRIETRGELRGVTVAEIVRLWPPSLAQPTRQWIGENIPAGSVPRGRFALRVPLPAAASAAADTREEASASADVAFDFDGLEVHYLGELPPASALRGSATLDTRGFNAKVTDGAVHGLHIRSGSVAIDYHASPVTLAVVADAEGPSAEILSLIDRPPLLLPTKIGIPSTGVAGTSEVHADIRLPIVAALEKGQVKVVAEAAMHGASHPALVGSTGIDGGELTVNVEESGAVEVRGTAAITGPLLTTAPSKVRVRYQPRDADATLEAAIDGPDAHAEGTAAFAAGGLQTVEIPRFQLGRNDFRLDLARDEAGVSRVSLDGARFDLEAASRALRSPQGGALRPSAPYALDFRFAHVDAAPGFELLDVSGAVQSDGKHLQQATATGRTTKGGTIGLDLGSGPTGKLRAHADQGGEMLHALGYVDGVSGGNLQVVAAIGDGGPQRNITGELSFTDFRVLNVPLLGKILSLGSLDGLASLLGKEGLEFSNLRAPFTWTDTTIEIHDARAVGALGITARGAIDREKSRIDLEGDLIPLDSLNSALGKVPVVGDLLTGKSSEIFGISYEVHGKLKSPEVRTNALSALAPGALRKMFSAMFSDSKSKPAKHPSE